MQITSNSSIFLICLGTLLLSGCGHRYAVMDNSLGEPVMLLGHDPVAYFTERQSIRGNPAIKSTYDDVVFYFASDTNKATFEQDPQQYFPQYGAFCSSGAAFGLKLGSDPTEFVIRDGKLYFFGDIWGRMAWMIAPDWNIEKADLEWPDSRDSGWRWQSLKRYARRVDWYKDTAAIREDYRNKHPEGSWPDYDPGGMITNLFLKSPGWRAREGFGQPATGFVGEDPCPPACPGVVSEPYPERGFAGVN